MARDWTQKTHKEQLQILPNTNHGDVSGDPAFEIFAAGADTNPASPGTATFKVLDTGDVTAVSATVPTIAATNIDAGASGTAGSVDVFPGTASKGKLAITCTNQTGNTTVTLNANAMGQATAVNIPDPGAATSYVVQSTAALTRAEVDVLDNATVGTVVASKVVIASADKDVGDFRNLDAVNIDAGASGAAGTVDVFPATALKGKLAITCTNQTNDTTVTLNAEAMGQATNIGIPDPGGADADVVLTAGTQTIAGNKTLSGTTLLSGATTISGAATLSSTAVGPGAGGVVYTKYARITVAAINAAGATGIPLLAAVAGRQYRVVNASITAYGGACTSTDATHLSIVSDLGGTPVELYQVAKAQLAQGTTAGVGINMMKPTTASTVVLADGASFVAQVANKAISLKTTTGGTYDWATATGVDVEIQYTVE